MRTRSSLPGIVNLTLALLRRAGRAVLLGLLLPCTGVAETEPNNRLGDAGILPPSGSVTGTLEPSNDEDWFQVTVSEPGRLTVSVEAPPANLRAHLALYGRHAEWLGVYAAAINDGDDLHLTRDLAEPGTYFLRLRDTQGRSIPASYTLASRHEPAPDPNEPNDVIGTATLIQKPTAEARIFPSGDEDWFRIFCPTDSRLGLELITPSAMNGEVALYDPDYAWIGVWASAVNPGDPVYLNHAIRRPGLYHVRVRDTRGGGHLATYRLTVSGGSPGFLPTAPPFSTENEVNDTLGSATPIAAGTSISGSLSGNSDADWYVLTPATPGQLTLAILETPASIALRAQFFDASGRAQVGSEASHAGDVFSLTQDLHSAERVFLRITAASPGTDPGPYRFSTKLLPVVDPFESNDRSGDSTPMAAVNQLTGFLFPAGDEDWFGIHVSQAGELQVLLSNLPGTLTPHLRLLDLSRSTLGSIAGSPGTDLRLATTVANPGTYLIRVTDAGGNASTGSYTLTVLGAEFTRFAPVARIDRITPGAIVVGDRVSFTGSGTDADGTIAGQVWHSNLDGELSTLPTFESANLSVGTHTISFRVRDNEGLWSTPVRELLYVGSSVSAEVEPNGSFFTANELSAGRPFTGKINTRGDIDHVRIHVPSAGRLIAEVSNVPANLRLEISCYNRYWEWIGLYAAAASPGDDVRLLRDLDGPTDVHFRLRDVLDGSNPDFTYTLLLRFEPAPDPFEPNNRLLEATPVSTSPLAGYLFPAGDEDWYRVWVPAGNRLEASLESVPDEVRAEISLYGRDREWLGRWQSAVNPGDPVSASLSEPAPAAGDYFVRVRTVAGSNGTRSYRLTLSGVDPSQAPPFVPQSSEREPNATVADATPVSVGLPVNATFATPNDPDWYTFKVQTPGLLRTRIDHPPRSVAAHLRVYRDDLTLLASRLATNPGDAIALDLALSDPGTYHVLIEATRGAFSASESYSLGLDFTSVTDAFEPNDHLQEATPLTRLNRIQAHLFTAGDADCYLVQAEAGALLRVSVADVPPELRPQLELFDHEGVRLAHKLASNEGQEILLTYPIPQTAGYTLRVRDVGDNSFSTQPYTLVIHGARFEAYTPLAVLDSVSPNPSASGEPVTFSGHGEDPDGSIVAFQWRSSLDGVFSAARVAETTTLTPGTHTVFFRVMDDSRNWSPETSTLVFFAVPAPAESEPNNLAGSATPLELDRPYTGTISPRDDQDWFRLTLDQPGRLIVKSSHPVGSPIRAQIEMYSPDLEWTGVYLAASNDGDPLTLPWDLPSAGTYYLRIRDLGGRDGGAYTLSATRVVPLDPYEPNGSAAAASLLEPSGRATASLFPAADEDWYAITLPGPGALRLHLDSVPSDVRLEIAVYGRDLAWLGVYTSANNPGDTVSLDYDPAEAGTYFAKIRSVNGTGNPSETYSLSVPFTPAVDSHEPNAPIAHATPVFAPSITGRIFPRNDEDFYRLEVPAEGALQVQTTRVPSNLRLELALYDANLAWMGVYRAAETEGGTVSLSLSPASGVYYLRVRDRDGDRIAGEDYTLSLLGIQTTPPPAPTPVLTESEPNNDLGHANPIAAGPDPISGTLAGNPDWFRLIVPEPCELRVQLTVSPNHRPEVRLYDANGSVVATRQAENRGDTCPLVHPLGNAGTYYLRLIDLDNASSSEPYALAVSRTPVSDPGEPNDGYAVATPLSFGIPWHAPIFPPGDTDWFALEVTEPGHVVVALQEVPPGLLAAIRIYDRNLVAITTRYAENEGDAIQAEFDAAAPAGYRVQVWDQRQNRYSIASYGLAASFTPSGDGAEPNNRFSTSTPLAEVNQVQGRVFPAGDVDWFRFSVLTPGPIRIQIAQTDGFQPHLVLRDDSGNQLAAAAARDAGEILELRHVVTAADTYHLSVSDVGNNEAGSESYVLTLLGPAFTRHHPLVTSPLRLGPNPSAPGEEVRLAAEVTDPDGPVTAYEWFSDRDGLLGNSPIVATTRLSPGLHHLSFRATDASGLPSARIDRDLIVSDDTLPETEYNNNPGTAQPVPLETWIVGRILPADDQDHFRFRIDRCGRLMLRLDAVPRGARLGITVYGDAGEWLGLDASAANAGTPVNLGFFVNPGSYVVRIRELSGTASPDTYALRAVFHEASDLYEPNPSFATATLVPLRTNLTALSLCPGDDEDWYRVEMPGAGRLSLVLNPSSTRLKGSLAVYDGDLAWIGVYNDANQGGDRVTLTHEVADAGTAFLRLRNLTPAPDPEPYELGVVFDAAPDIHEPNDGGGAAALLQSQDVDARIFPRGEEDWYRIHLAAGSEAVATLTQVPAAMRGEIALYGPDLEWLGRYETANNRGDQVRLTYRASNTGFLHVRIRDVDGDSHLAPYHLTVTGGTPGFEPPFTPRVTESEPNGSLSTATDLALDTDLRGGIQPVGDEDVYRVWIQSPGVLAVRLTEVPATVISELWVLDRDLRQIAYRRTTNPGEDNLLTLATTKSGYHYLRIRDFQRSAPTGNPYLLRVSLTPVVDPHEPNDSLGHATPLAESTIRAQVFDGADMDWYRVWISKPGPLSLSLVSVPADLRPELRIVDANGTQRGTWVNTNPGVGGDAVLRYEAPSPGFYYVRVHAPDGRYSEQPYILRIEGAELSSAPTLIPIGDRSLTESIEYGFTVDGIDPDNPAQLRFSARNLPPGASFDPVRRTFRWRPAFGMAGTYAGIHFEVTDGTFSDAEEITLTVAALSRAPVLAPIGNRLLPPERPFTLQLSATDPDPSATLVFAAANLPPGAAFDPATRLFSWTPTARQVGVFRDVRFSVTDGTWTDVEWVTFEVTENLDPYEAWVIDHFTEVERGRPEVSGADADPDGDGATNRSEYEADTLPKNPESVLVLTGVTATPGGLEIRWRGGEASIQYLERSPAVVGPDAAWVPILTNPPPTTPSVRQVDPTPGPGPSFYRIRVRRP